jgi:hypothetical protein
MDKRLLTIGVGALGIFSGGVGLGYILGSRHKTERIVFRTANVEVEELEVDDQLQLDFDDAVVDITEEVVVTEVSESYILHSHTKQASEGWDYKEELQQRSEDHPYIIHYDEYMDDELNFAQSTLTYFAGDNILVDDRDAPIYNHDQLVGHLIFGHGSGDPNVVYVRNHKIKCEWEIVLDDSRYEDTVGGQTQEQNLEKKGFKHGTPRFRWE